MSPGALADVDGAAARLRRLRADVSRFIAAGLLLFPSCVMSYAQPDTDGGRSLVRAAMWGDP